MPGRVPPLLRDLRRAAAPIAPPPATGPPGAEPAAGLSRRDLLARAGALGTAAALAGPAGALATRARPAATAPRVAVVGAGLAGLTCALRLAEHGLRAEVFDARDRVGGRCWTARAFADGQVAEHGGEFIDTRHVHLRRLARQLGITLDDRQAAGQQNGGRSASILVIGGVPQDQAAVFAQLGPALTRLTADAKRIGSYRYDQASRAARAFDEMSARNWVQEHVAGGTAGVAGAGLAILLTSFFGLDLDRMSAINLIEGLLGDDGTADDRYHVRGGNDRIPRAVAARLPHGSVHLGSPLEAVVRRSDGSYRLEFGGRPRPVVADRVVLTLPFPALREVDLTRSGLSARRRRAIAELAMGTNAKLLLQFRRRFSAFGWDGTYATERPNQTTWDSSLTQGGAAGLLTVFTGGRVGAGYPVSRPHGPAPAGVVAGELQRLDAAVPGLRAAHTGRSWLDSWVDDPWARGSYAGFGPGQYTRYWHYLGRREGRIHFAGEHTSTHSQGYLNGGVESGERAAREVLAARG